MRVLPYDRKLIVIEGLCNGMSMRAASRVFKTHRTAIQRLLVRVGKRCDHLLTEHMQDVQCRYLELDELWTFCGKKQRRLSLEETKNPNLGDQYLFFAIDHETKVVPCWELGKRTVPTAIAFLTKLKGSLNGCIPQISTDAWTGYDAIMEAVFGGELDYATISKFYESEHTGRGRYAPPRVAGIQKNIVAGVPISKMICTSIVERSNLTVRTMQRRFTRLSLGFSRKIEHLQAAIALHFAFYNFVWQPRTLGGLTPAMADSRFGWRMLNPSKIATYFRVR